MAVSSPPMWWSRPALWSKAASSTPPSRSFRAPVSPVARLGGPSVTSIPSKHFRRFVNEHLQPQRKARRSAAAISGGASQAERSGASDSAAEKRKHRHTVIGGQTVFHFNPSKDRRHHGIGHQQSPQDYWRT